MVKNLHSKCFFVCCQHKIFLLLLHPTIISSNESNKILMRVYKLIILLLMIIANSCEEASEDVNEIKYGFLEGTVFDERNMALSDASVEISPTTSTITNNAGQYSFNKLRVGEYSMKVSKDHYITQIQEFQIIENEITTQDFILKAGTSYFDISDSLFSVSASSNVVRVEISSNGVWKIENSASWVGCSQISGEGNAVISITCTKNIENQDRMSTIRFVSGDIAKTVMINQSSPIILLDYQGFIGNEELNIMDSIFLQFNKPIKVSKITASYSNCISDIDVHQVDSGKSVMFSYSCAKLGLSFPFSVSVSDDYGNTLNESITVNFFKSKLDFEGVSFDFLLINEDKEVLIATNEPDRIVRYSIALDSIIQIYDLEGYIAPRKLSYNYFNDKVYMMGSDLDFWGTFLIDLPEIYTLDLESSQIEKIIAFKATENDHPEYPVIYPYDIEFTKSGLGMVLMMANGSSSNTFMLIDSSKDDSIYNYPYPHLITNYDNFTSIHPNFDHSKILILPDNGSVDYGVFKEEDQSISILRPSPNISGQSNFLVPNRVKDVVYIGQLYEQYIMDFFGNVTHSHVSLEDTRGDSSADFSYRSGESNVIYYVNRGSFQIIDYGSTANLLKCDINPKLIKLTSTTNGNYIIAFKQTYSFQSDCMYVFETEDVMRNIK